MEPESTERQTSDWASTTYKVLPERTMPFAFPFPALKSEPFTFVHVVPESTDFQTSSSPSVTNKFLFPSIAMTFPPLPSPPFKSSFTNRQVMPESVERQTSDWASTTSIRVLLRFSFQLMLFQTETFVPSKTLLV